MKPFALLLLLLALLGCGKSPESRILGTWRTQIGDFEVTATFREDGTFTQTSGNGKVSSEIQGTYRVSDKSLTQTLTKMSVNGESIRIDDRKTVTGDLRFLDDDTAETTSNGKTVKMARVTKSP